jgi:UDP-GlcNAc:undecaprenyl-phosphate/decaprenyl-phosphate GlcNAc-1-phosphate transferase
VSDLKFNIIFNIAIIFLLSFGITSILIPIILQFLSKKRIYDKHTNLKQHTGFIPTLGGVAIVLGVVISQLFFILSFPEYRMLFLGYEYLAFCSLILFILGIVDDIINLDSMLKFLIQFLVSLIMVWKANLYINSFRGLFGIYEIPAYFSYVISIFIIIFLINAFNLIDGIDSIASVLGITYSIFFALLSFSNSLYPELILSISVVGALLSFWYYNKTPSKIFMGDSGTLVIGLIIAFYIIRLYDSTQFFYFDFHPILFIPLLIYPVTDTIRVIVLRLYKGISPFRGDRRHIHHILVNSGLTHVKTTFYILVFNLTLFFIVLLLGIDSNYSLLIVLVYVFLSLRILAYVSGSRANK